MKNPTQVKVLLEAALKINKQIKTHLNEALNTCQIATNQAHMIAYTNERHRQIACVEKLLVEMDLLLGP